MLTPVIPSPNRCYEKTHAQAEASQPDLPHLPIFKKKTSLSIGRMRQNIYFVT